MPRSRAPVPPIEERIAHMREYIEKFGSHDHEKLVDVLRRVIDQAAYGKGADRRVTFSEQQMQQLIDGYGVGYALGAAAKNMRKSLAVLHDDAVENLLCAINHIACAIIYMEDHRCDRFANDA